MVDVTKSAAYEAVEGYETEDEDRKEAENGHGVVKEERKREQS